MARPLPQKLVLCGDLHQVPLTHLLLMAERERFTGTVILSPDQNLETGAREALIRMVDGIAVAGDLGLTGATSLFSGLLTLSARPKGRYLCQENDDLVGASRGVLRGHIDPQTLLASSVRQSARQDAVERVLETLESGTLQLRWNCSFSRLGLSRDEWNFVQELRRMGGRLDELLTRSPLPPEATRQMVYLLFQTGILVRLPGGRRLESQDVSILLPTTIDEALEAYVAEDPTLVCDFEALNTMLLEPPPPGTTTDAQDAPPISMYPGMVEDGAVFEALRLFHLAQGLTSRGQLHEALTRIHSALALQPGDPRYLAHKARILLELSPPGAPLDSEITTMLRQALDMDDGCEIAHDTLGRVMSVEGNRREAYFHFRKAAAINPCNLYAVQRILEEQPSDQDTTRPSFWERLRRSIAPFGKAG